MHIKVLESVAFFKACEALQRKVWGFSDLEVVSASNMVATGHAGGMTAGAFDDETLVGFVSGFAAHDPGQASSSGLHSHMLAVLPSHRGRGVGKALKWFQRDWCLARDLTWMTWTFDPLQAKNAKLNVEHLGVTVQTYRINEYGELGGGLNAGLPTDRLVAFWDLTGARTVSLSEGRPLPLVEVNRSAVVLTDAEGKPVHNAVVASEKGHASVHVAIPKDLNKLLQTDLELALGWRVAVREVLTSYFERGYQIIRFKENFYILEKKNVNR